jgi:hypothetical protein
MNISLVNFAFFQFSFYARGSIITRDGFGETGVME